MGSWAKPIDVPVICFSEIMSQDLAEGQLKKKKSNQKPISQHNENKCDHDIHEDFSFGCLLEGKEDIESDRLIAQMLQSQFDDEYNNELRCVEKQRNKQSKITVSLNNYFRDNNFKDSDFDEETSERKEDEAGYKRDWDHFETNDKLFDSIPKCGFRLNEGGKMITKHDPKLCGVRNACRVMSFPPNIATGDGASFEMNIPNKVFNQLKSFSRRENAPDTKQNKMHDRKDNMVTAAIGLDSSTRLLLYKFINNQVLEHINGIVSTGKEAVILHAKTDPSYLGPSNDKHHHKHNIETPQVMPKECAVKIFKTTLNEFKQRYLYLKDDECPRGRHRKSNNRSLINIWAEKENYNMIRMQKVGINCPQVVALKNHVLVMSFIGNDGRAAPKLRDTCLDQEELNDAYKEIVEVMCKLFKEAKLIHGDLSEYNILWFKKKCWIIDVAQSVDTDHPRAMELLMRDCSNIINFFAKRGVSKDTKEELFEHIISLKTHDIKDANCVLPTTTVNDESNDNSLKETSINTQQ